jgi:hypothetical protein
MPDVWARNYTNIRGGDTLRLYGIYRGKKLQPRTLANIVWRHFLHPEAKSTGPDGSPCSFWTQGLLQRRCIKAAKPFCFIGKEIERKAQDVHPSTRIRILEAVEKLERFGENVMSTVVVVGVSCQPNVRNGLR